MSKEKKVFYAEPFAFTRVLVYVIVFVLTIASITFIPTTYSNEYYSNQVEFNDEIYKEILEVESFTKEDLTKSEKLIKSYTLLESKKKKDETIIHYFYFSFVVAFIVVAILEVLFRKTLLIKIEFSTNYFTYQDKKFQYIDLKGFDFFDRSITLYIKHYKEPLKIYFLDENDADDFAFEIKQHIYV